MVMKKRKPGISQPGNKTGLLCLTTAATALAVLAMLFAVLSVCISSFDLPLYYVSPMATSSISIAAFAAAAHLTGKTNQNGLVWGFAVGASLCLLLTVVSFFRNGLSYSQAGGTKLVAICCSGALGGYFGMIRGEKKRRQKRG